MPRPTTHTPSPAAPTPTQEFVGDGLRWAHVDIAGPSFNKGSAYGHVPAGGTGCTVATLVELATGLVDGLVDGVVDGSVA